jgi:hypothetical protein
MSELKDLCVRLRAKDDLDCEEAATSIEGLQAALNSAKVGFVELPAKREHITTDEPCWCNPEVTYVNPETGRYVVVHKDPM